MMVMQVTQTWKWGEGLAAARNDCDVMPRKAMRDLKQAFHNFPLGEQ